MLKNIFQDFSQFMVALSFTLLVEWILISIALRYTDEKRRARVILISTVGTFVLGVIGSIIVQVGDTYFNYPSLVEPMATYTSPVDGMILVSVPAGEFIMGDNEAFQRDQRPEHKVYLNEFMIDQTEVTNKMYSQCVSAGVCIAPSKSILNSNVPYYGNSTYDNFPVIYVSWRDAVTYCQWAGRRLPTEAEWEKAARGDDERKYPWGNLDPAESSKPLLNYLAMETGPVEVGSYPYGASPYGVFDMAGNVYEWVADIYGDDNYYSLSPYENPQGPETGDFRVVRGGAWRDDKLESISTTYRFGLWQGNRDDDFAGFRCALSVQ